MEFSCEDRYAQASAEQPKLDAWKHGHFFSLAAKNRLG